VQLLPEGQPPIGFDRITAEPLTEDEVERAITGSLSGARLLGQPSEEDFRISLAGAQEKTALLFHRGRWCRPLGATPTTHILKLPLGLIGHLQVDLQDSIENEWLCLRLMNAYGLDTAAGELLQFGARKVLAVERFDRALQSAGWIARLPQEDFCQALGLPSSKKYESDGGPGMRDILRVLDSSHRAETDKRSFVKAQIVFWMLAATDGHGKNFSLFHERGGTYRLTPFYDVLSAWPIIGPGPNKFDYHKVKLAMAVRGKNAHWKLAEIKAGHWDAVARLAGLGNATEILHDIAVQTPRIIEKVNLQLPRKFPAVVRDKIFDGLQRMATRLDGVS
jgi:serine/threonine-protein kinase HipA